MAILQVNLFSQSLMRTVPVNVILPVEKAMAEGNDKPFKTLYLLHGLYGNCTDWLNDTRIRIFAYQNNIAVVMPSGENGFYVDHKPSHSLYGEFVGDELVKLTREMFHLSNKREDTIIGGLSMGGFGALRNGLKYSDTFGSIICLSAAFHLEKIADTTTENDNFYQGKAFLEACFGDLTKLLGSDNDPKFIAKQLCDSGMALPQIYIACGESDSLLDENREMSEFLSSLGADVTYEQGSGAHEWGFWDAYIKRAIDWVFRQEKH